MRPVARLLILAISAFSLTSCLQSSTVVRVKKDGSGAIFARYYFSPQMTAMLGGLAGGLGGLGGEGVNIEGPDVDTQKIFKPTKEDLENDAASYGEGVRYAKHEEAKNAEGWEGYLVVYEFDDINKVKFDPNQPPGPLKELENMDPEAAAEAKKGISDESSISFVMEDGTLVVKTGISKDSLGQMAESGNLGDMVGPDGQIPPEAAAQMGMAAGMMAGARVAVFVRIDGEIAETDASHVNGTLITLSDVEMAKMMQDSKFLDFMQQVVSAGDNPDDATLEKMVKSFDAVDGVTMETKQKFMVKIK